MSTPKPKDKAKLQKRHLVQEAARILEQDEELARFEAERYRQIVSLRLRRSESRA